MAFGFGDKKQKHIYNKKASLTFDEVMWFYDQGTIAAQLDELGDKNNIESKVFEKLYVLFPERRDKQLNWKNVDDVLAEHLPLEVRSKLLGKIFSP